MPQTLRLDFRQKSGSYLRPNWHGQDQMVMVMTQLSCLWQLGPSHHFPYCLCYPAGTTFGVRSDSSWGPPLPSDTPSTAAGDTASVGPGNSSAAGSDDSALAGWDAATHPNCYPCQYIYVYQYIQYTNISFCSVNKRITLYVMTWLRPGV